MAHPVVSCLCQLMNFLGFGTVLPGLWDCLLSLGSSCVLLFLGIHAAWLGLASAVWPLLALGGVPWGSVDTFLHVSCSGCWSPQHFGLLSVWTFGVSVLMWFSSPTLCDENHMSHHPQQSHLCWGCGCPHKIKDHTACHCYCLLLLECFVSGFLCGAFCSLWRELGYHW